MKIGFTSFCTESFREIMDALVESVLEFSKYEITVFSINFDYIHSDDRVKFKRIDVGDPSYYEICKIKIISSIECGYDIGLVLDCDMIVTDEIDKIFDENYEKILNSKFPLFAKHPHNPFARPDHYAMSVIKNFTDKKPKMNYVYASYLFSNENRWFLQEVLDVMKHNNVQGEDEIIINALLTKYEVDYDIGYNYLPNGYDENVYGYSNNIVSPHIKEHYLDYGCPVKFFIFHGHNCKNPEKMKEYINLIKEKKNNL
jgi:hypothetical protein